MTSLYDWSPTNATTNGVVDTTAGISIAEGATPPPNVNNGMRAMMLRTAQLRDDIGGVVVETGTNTLIITTSGTPYTAYVTGMLFRFIAAASNTAAVTATVNAGSSKKVRKISGGTDVDLGVGDILQGGYYETIFAAAADSAAGAWILQNPSGTTLPTTFLDNVFRVKDDGDATKQIALQASGITTGTTRTITMPDSDVTLQPVTTSAQYLANTAGKSLSTDQVWGAVAVPTALTPGATVAWDMSLGIDFTLAPVQNFTLSNPTNVKVGQRGRIRIVQDGTGSRTFTKSSNMKTAGGVAIVLTTTAAAIDYIDYDVASSTEIRLSVSKGWA